MSAVFSFVRSFGFLIVLAAVYILFSLMAPSFFGMANLISILHVVAPLIIVASGMALVVISGRLDISVGSIAYVASAIFTILMRDWEVPVLGALAAAIAVGLVLGAVNGLIDVGLRANALIATLATMVAFRGLGLSLTNGGLIVMPQAGKPVCNKVIGPIFLDTVIALAILAGVHLVHRHTAFGRQLTAIGNGEDVARRIGIPIERRTFAALVLSGLLAAIAGVMYTMQVAVSTAKIGEGMEFTAVAAVVVGGI